MNRMDTARRANVIRCLIEGSSINSTCRMTGVAKNTVLKLLVENGSACSAFLDQAMRNLPCQKLQADEAFRRAVLKVRRGERQRLLNVIRLEFGIVSKSVVSVR